MSISNLRWTAERITVLKRMWPDFSASQIARHFGEGFTRDMVCGKVYRLGLSKRGGKRDISRRRKSVYDCAAGPAERD